MWTFSKSLSYKTLSRADTRQSVGFTLGAFVNEKLGGIVSFERDGKTREKQRHKATLFRMYISPDFRGYGISRKLIEELLERARLLPYIEQINLTVVTDNLRAKKLYESYGFKVFSTELNAFKWKDKYFSEDQMVLFLK